MGRGSRAHDGQVRARPSDASAPRASDQATGRNAIHVLITESEGWYVAECLEIAVVTQGRSLDATLDNLRAALELHLDAEELLRVGLSASPKLVVSYETAAFTA